MKRHFIGKIICTANGPASLDFGRWGFVWLCFINETNYNDSQGLIHLILLSYQYVHRVRCLSGAMQFYHKQEIISTRINKTKVDFNKPFD